MHKSLLLLGLVSGAVSAQASVIFADGFNFEQSSAPATFTTVTGGQIGPWVVGENGVDRIGGYWQAAEGNGSVDMSALGVGTLSTELTTVTGETYFLSFYVAGNPVVTQQNC